MFRRKNVVTKIRAKQQFSSKFWNLIDGECRVADPLQQCGLLLAAAAPLSGSLAAAAAAGSVAATTAAFRSFQL